MSLLRPVTLALLLALGGTASLQAQDEPLTAGAEGVPVPKKTRHVQPVYPAEALAQGIRGIVILDLVVDARGKVASTSVLRSVPGLDEAAIAAARQWEYEPSKIDGKPVSVRVTVPITFSLALPRLTRQAGVPELRQGIVPSFPAGAPSGGLATAEVTLEPDGRIAVANLISGDAPWTEALLAALRTWRFAPAPDDAVLSFRVEAEFVKARGSDPDSVQLRASGLRRSELLADPGAGPATPQAPGDAGPATPAGQAPTPQPVAAPAAAIPEAATPAVSSPAALKPQSPIPGPSAAQPKSVPPAVPQPPTTAVAGPAAGPSPGPASVMAPAGSATPPVEVITAPAPAPPPEGGVSAVRDVTLEAGVPELARGRRPVPPPLARMSGTTGTVKVSFSVSAGGTTALQTASGSDLLRYAAEQTVASWVFRRSRADRAYLVAVFTYESDRGSAVVRPQAAPLAAQPAEPAAATPPATQPPVPPPPPTSPPAVAVPPPAPQAPASLK